MQIAMRTFYKLISLIATAFLPMLLASQLNGIDYTKLGKGRIVEKDRSVRKNITLQEIHPQTEEKAGYIVYMKDGSLHDMPIEEIDRIEFPEAEQGPVKMVFRNNTTVVTKH
jgi:hypothetical protein